MSMPKAVWTEGRGLLRKLVGPLGAAAVVATLSSSAAAQPEPAPAPPPPADPTAEPPPPPPAPSQPAPAYGQPPPPGYGQQPPPGYGQPPPPGYGQQPPPGYGYGPPPPQGPEEMDYIEGMTIPPGYTRDSQIRKGLVIGGAVTFGTMWLLSVAVGAVAMEIEEEDDEWGGDSDGVSPTDAGMLMIPVGGPFISIATYEASAGGAVLLVIDGIAQAGGLAMLIVGLAAKKDVLVRTGDVEMTVTPMVGQGRTGLGVLGRF